MELETTPTVDLEHDDADIDPTKLLLPEPPQTLSEAPSQNGSASAATQLQLHLIRSISSTVSIRQLLSQGLSFQLWPAATTLVTLLDGYRSDPSLSPLASALSRPLRLSVLEIGSGTGLVGIAAAATLGADVTVTDLPHVVENLRFNAEANREVVDRNRGMIHVAPLRWGEDGDAEAVGRGFDVILASDVVYYDHLYEPLIETMRWFLCGEGEGREVVFFMAHLKRWKKESAFFRRARKFFCLEVVHVDQPLVGSRVGVVVYKFTRKGAIVKI